MKTFKLDTFFNDPDSYTKFCIVNSQAKEFAETKSNEFTTRDKTTIYKNSLKGLLIEEINKFLLDQHKKHYFVDNIAEHSLINYDMFDLMTDNGKTIDVKSWSQRTPAETTKNLDHEWTKKRRIDYYVVFDLPEFKDLKQFDYETVKNTLKYITFYGFIPYSKFERYLSKFPDEGYVSPDQTGRHQNYFYVIPKKAPRWASNIVNINFDDYLKLFDCTEPIHPRQSHILSSWEYTARPDKDIQIKPAKLTKAVETKWNDSYYNSLGDIRLAYQNNDGIVKFYKDDSYFNWQAFNALVLKTALKNKDKRTVVYITRDMLDTVAFAWIYTNAEYLNVLFVITD